MDTITDTDRINFLDEECVDFRCKEISYGDDADVYYEVVMEFYQEPHERIIGIGKTARKAIDEAINHIRTNGDYAPYDPILQIPIKLII